MFVMYNEYTIKIVLSVIKKQNNFIIALPSNLVSLNDLTFVFIIVLSFLGHFYFFCLFIYMEDVEQTLVFWDYRDCYHMRYIYSLYGYYFCRFQRGRYWLPFVLVQGYLRLLLSYSSLSYRNYSQINNNKHYTIWQKNVWNTNKNLLLYCYDL